MTTITPPSTKIPTNAPPSTPRSGSMLGAWTKGIFKSPSEYLGAAQRSLQTVRAEFMRQAATAPPPQPGQRYSDGFIASELLHGAAQATAKNTAKTIKALIHHHPQLIETKSHQVETWGSILGGLLHPASRSGKTRTEYYQVEHPAIPPARAHTEAILTSLARDYGRIDGYEIQQLGREITAAEQALQGLRQLINDPTGR